MMDLRAGWLGCIGSPVLFKLFPVGNFFHGTGSASTVVIVVIVCLVVVVVLVPVGCMPMIFMSVCS